MSQEHVDKFSAALEARQIKRVFICGSYTSPDRWTEEQNVRNAEAVGYRVSLAGCYPVIPHANTRVVYQFGKTSGLGVHCDR